MKTKPKPRVIPEEIRPLHSTAPWYKLTAACKESGLSVSTITEAGILIRRFGRTDYVRTQLLNDWINLVDDPASPSSSDEESASKGIGKSLTFPHSTIQ